MTMRTKSAILKALASSGCLLAAIGATAQVAVTETGGDNNAAGLPGVTAVQVSGQTGAYLSTFRVHGVSDKEGSRPLVIVDGVPMSMDQVKTHDIESVSILKADAAVAIYGELGANGVILVTTKSGGKGNERAAMPKGLGGETPSIGVTDNQPAPNL